MQGRKPKTHNWKYMLIIEATSGGLGTVSNVRTLYSDLFISGSKQRSNPYIANLPSLWSSEAYIHNSRN